MWEKVFKFLGAPVYLLGMLWYLLLEVPFFQGRLRMFYFISNKVCERSDDK